MIMIIIGIEVTTTMMIRFQLSRNLLMKNISTKKLSKSIRIEPW